MYNKIQPQLKVHGRGALETALRNNAFVFLQRFNVPDDCDKHETNGRIF